MKETAEKEDKVGEENSNWDGSRQFPLEWL